MKKTPIIPLRTALGVLALASGAITVLYQPLVAQQGQPPFGPGGGPQGGPPSGGPPGGPLESALQRLDLTPEQQVQVQKILEEERTRLHNRISSVLTEEQRTMFRQMTSRRGPGGPPGGFGQGGGGGGFGGPGGGPGGGFGGGGRQVTPADNKVDFTVQGANRQVRSNGVPNHPMGEFPNAGNPNAVQAQSYNFRMPLRPQRAQQVSLVRHDLFGVALSGVPFDPGTGEFWNNDRRWNYDALSGKINLGIDFNNAHVQPGGVYHYHGRPVGLINKLEKKNQMTLLGYAADGFPIYDMQGYATANDLKSDLKKLRSSYRLKPGTRPAEPDGPGGAYDGTFSADWQYVAGAGDLDECNGRTGVTAEYPQGTYYYILTDEFPFVPRYFRGTPDTSFQKPRGGGPGGPGGGPGGGPPFGGPPPGGPGGFGGDQRGGPPFGRPGQRPGTGG